MSKTRPLAFITAALVAALTLSMPNTAHAADGDQSITLSPSNTTVSVDPGATATRKITLINDGDTSYPVSLSVDPYRVSGETYDPQFTRIPGTTSASSWVTLSMSSLSLAAHTPATVGYTITVPKSTAPGGYYAVIFAETGNSPSDAGVTTHSRVGNILYITVNGPVNTGGSLTAVDLPKLMFGTDVSIGMKISNTGGVHYQSDSTVTVTSMTGKSVFEAHSTHFILPQTTRLVTENWSPKSLAGIYKVSRSASVVGNDQSLPDQWIVVVTPRIIPFIIFIALAVAGFVILLGRTASKRKNKRKQRP